MLILAIYDRIGFLQTKGAPLLGEAPLIGRLRYYIEIISLMIEADCCDMNEIWASTGL